MPPRGAERVASSMTAVPSDRSKNILGTLGERCNNCSGAGFTNNLTGGSEKCGDCFGTGVKAPDIYKLAELVVDLTRRIDDLERK